MRQKKPFILILLLFAAGLAILLYPLASEWYNGRAQTTVVEAYNDTVANMETTEIEALREAAYIYNEGLRGSVVLTDPFDVSTEEKSKDEYEAQLNPSGNGVMGSVRIPEIDVRLPIYHGTSHEVLIKGAGHLENTSLPVGGEGTHPVISAHSGLPTAALFTDLVKMEEGSLFFVDILGESLAYKVDQIKVVNPDDVTDLFIVPEKEYVTLVTCTPYGVNSHRLLVRGERTEVLGLAKAQPAIQKSWSWPYLFALPAFLVPILAALAAAKLRKNERNKGCALQEAHALPIDARNKNTNDIPGQKIN